MAGDAGHKEPAQGGRGPPAPAPDVTGPCRVWCARGTGTDGDICGQTGGASWDMLMWDPVISNPASNSVRGPAQLTCPLWVSVSPSTK